MSFRSRGARALKGSTEIAPLELLLGRNVAGEYTVDGNARPHRARFPFPAA